MEGQLSFYARAALMGYKHDCEVQEFYQSYLAKKDTILSKYFEKAQTLPKNIPCGETRFMIQELPEEILIIFPGTRQELLGFCVDAHADFDIPLKETTFLGETFKTHRGFLRRYLSYRRRLLEIVSEFGKDKRFVVVGHSLGAAVATFASLELKNKGYDVFCVTLAGPKIGDASFNSLAERINPPTVRINRINDPMPKLSAHGPFRVEAYGEEIIIDEPNAVWTGYAIWVAACSFVFKSGLLMFFMTIFGMGVSLTLTHSMKGYINILDQLENQNRKLIKETAKNYPERNIKCIFQWLPMSIITAIGYVWYYTSHSIRRTRKYLRKTLPRQLAEKILEDSGAKHKISVKNEKQI
ncbi:Oidioi.mRNA.OKI2018_I69.chr2.g4194.t1.cds [Oikopleura dioica]|uniref:Oidioi.mRNA.OKI2018_I69.chr2.g4194.t1.cds n=1 Tax=Oikopleura dioica TaxID=34765 RepID=A0ABN7T5M6_OIKDI|nr:Oidioi.mRNA.OKI2018_I69.chr2.g4194.t1.cds [Oikopleura dioica]